MSRRARVWWSIWWSTRATDAPAESDLPPAETIKRLRKLLGAKDTFDRVAAAASAEPPRVRAMLGALGQEMRVNPTAVERLRRSLNPLSRFEFGQLRQLRHAREWQAR